MFTVPTEIAEALVNGMDAACQAFLTAPLPAPPLYSLSGNMFVLNYRVSDLAPQQRYGILNCLELPNGIKMLRIAAVDNALKQATLEVHFFNTNFLNDIVATYNADRTRGKRIFPIYGGHRVLAGPATGQVQVDSSPAPAAIVFPDPNQPILLLTVKPIGDYSTYTLGVNATEIQGLATVVFDPLFAEINFKFRPGCFSLNCAPEWEASPPPSEEPLIDYLAKDFESFRLTMISAMMERVPEWQATSEADLDHVLLELFSAAADELSDYQDRVANEAYLATARKRVSLARHSRLMDYHIHQGNQASAWLALELALEASAIKEFDLSEGFEVWSGREKEDEASIVFMSRYNGPQRAHQLLNSMSLYTWSDSIPTLAAGSAYADLRLYQALYADVNPPQITPATDQASAETVRDLIRSGRVARLLIQERLNPATGLVAGRDLTKRQLVELLPGDEGADAMLDPITNEWFVRARWRQEDALRKNYCFTIECPAPVGKVEHVSLFHGNLVEVFHGRPQTAIFKDPSEFLTNANEFHYERVGCWETKEAGRCEETKAGRWGAICRLPGTLLAYRNTPPGGEIPPQSTLELEVEEPGGGVDQWDEAPSLIHSDDSDENGDRFVVETDELRRSLIRFGNGVNGKELPDKAIVRCFYQAGDGPDGNIGADKLTKFDANTPLANPVLLKVRRCWNPFDITSGKPPEPAAEIIRRVPEAYRARQLRAVTLQDYVNRAEELEEVSRAAASYAWTGSWRTVRVTIDPVGTNVLADETRKRVADYLDAVRLIGEDLEIRPPRFVPLEIHVALCVDPNYWIEDVRFVLVLEFSASWTPDGRMGFFHPDLWTFGQPIHASQIVGRALSVEGVEHIISISIKRWNDASTASDYFGNLRHNEIIQVLSDPDQMELGFIEFDIKGGRR